MFSRLDDAISSVAYILDSLMAYRNISETGNCNTCKISSTCPYAQKAGQLVRYNCPLHVKAEASHREAARRPVEAETGEWMPKHSQWSKTWECSKCSYRVNLEDGGIYHYCSACGKKLEEDDG